MAHRLYTNDKQQGVQQAWHGLTEVVPVITLEKNWLTEWDLRPVQMEKRGQPSKWTVLECSDNPEIEIGAPYNPATFQPVDNAAFLQMVRDSISGTAHKVVSVGSVRNRGRVFVSIELIGMEQFEAAGRKFSAYLNFGNGHDKSSVLWVNTSNTCVVCDNTFSCNLVSVENKAAKGGESEEAEVSLRQRHTKNVKLKLPAISTLVDKAVGVQAEFQLALEGFGAEPLDVGDATNLFAGFVGRKIEVPDRRLGLSTRSFNTVSRLSKLFVEGRGNGGATVADAFSAVTDYYTHESSGGDNMARQVLSSEYGAGAMAKRDFWTILTKGRMAEVCEAGEELLTNTES